MEQESILAMFIQVQPFFRSKKVRIVATKYAIAN